jgi:DNA-binding NtrC family response regulator
MPVFWSRPRQEPVKFIYMTGTPARASDIRRVTGATFEMQAVAPSIDAALGAAARSGARVLLTDAELPGCSWRDVVAASRSHVPALSVVVILDSFEGSQWVEIIRSSAYDVVLRPLRSEPLRQILLGANQSAGARKTLL